MKLSKAQEAIMNEAKKEIDRARSCETVEEYFYKYQAHHNNHLYNTPEKIIARDPKMWEGIVKNWKDNKNGIVLVTGNSRSLSRLQTLGLIEILYDSNGERYGIDHIKVLNY